MIVRFVAFLPNCYQLLDSRLGESYNGEGHSGIVPDICLCLLTPEGQSDFLAEIKKCITGKTWFQRGQEGRGTNRRAGGLAKL